ncbi:hypothetical protein MPCS_01312 [Candidatus Megaera polyxenophila]|nr:hypothetical protein MPCS_01312 [Candidatus Megaera polyxenophila]
MIDINAINSGILELKIDITDKDSEAIRSEL